MSKIANKTPIKMDTKGPGDHKRESSATRNDRDRSRSHSRSDSRNRHQGGHSDHRSANSKEPTESVHNKDPQNDDGDKNETKSAEEKKFTGRCRLFVGNLTPDVSEDDFKKMFQTYGEISEVYLNSSRGFGFIRLDYRQNAEAAKAALDGLQRRGRVLRVRFATHGAALKVKNLHPYVSNELLEQTFTQFGELERAIVIVDDRGKPTGEGLVEFVRKPGAQQALRRINEGVLLFGSEPKPIEVEPLEQKDDEDGMPEIFLPKNEQYKKEREKEPYFAPQGSFEYEFGMRWKQVAEMEKKRIENVKKEMDEARIKLEDEMQTALYDYQAEQIRQDLLRQQEELRRLEELRNQDRMRRQQELEMRMMSRRAEEERTRQQEDRRRQEMMMRQQEMQRRSGGPVDAGLSRSREDLMGMRGEGTGSFQGGLRDMGMRGGQSQAEAGLRGRGGAPPLQPPPAPPAGMGLDRGQQGMGMDRGPQGLGMDRGPQGLGMERGPQGLGMERGPQGMERGPQGMERGPQGMERGPQGMDRGPQGMDRGPQGMDRGPQGMDRGPQGMERGAGSERGPQGIERGPPGVERGAQGMERGPQGADRGPQGMERGPRAPDLERRPQGVGMERGPQGVEKGSQGSGLERGQPGGPMERGQQGGLPGERAGQQGMGRVGQLAQGAGGPVQGNLGGQGGLPNSGNNPSGGGSPNINSLAKMGGPGGPANPMDADHEGGCPESPSGAGSEDPAPPSPPSEDSREECTPSPLAPPDDLQVPPPASEDTLGIRLQGVPDSGLGEEHCKEFEKWTSDAGHILPNAYPDVCVENNSVASGNEIETVETLEEFRLLDRDVCSPSKSESEQFSFWEGDVSSPHRSESGQFSCLDTDVSSPHRSESGQFSCLDTEVCSPHTSESGQLDNVHSPSRSESEQLCLFDREVEGSSRSESIYDINGIEEEVPFDQNVLPETYTSDHNGNLLGAGLDTSVGDDNQLSDDLLFSEEDLAQVDSLLADDLPVGSAPESLNASHPSSEACSPLPRPFSGISPSMATAATGIPLQHAHPGLAPQPRFVRVHPMHVAAAVAAQHGRVVAATHRRNLLAAAAARQHAAVIAQQRMAAAAAARRQSQAAMVQQHLARSCYVGAPVVVRPQAFIPVPGIATPVRVRMRLRRSVTMTEEYSVDRP